MLAPERTQTEEITGDVAEVTRMADALMQAGRIEEYLPQLEARADALATELRDLRELIRDERKALADLRLEGSSTRAQVRSRYRNQGRESPV